MAPVIVLERGVRVLSESLYKAGSMRKTGKKKFLLTERGKFDYVYVTQEAVVYMPPTAKFHFTSIKETFLELNEFDLWIEFRNGGEYKWFVVKENKVVEVGEKTRILLAEKEGLLKKWL